MAIDLYMTRDVPVRVKRAWGAQANGAIITLPPRRRAQLLRMGMVEEIEAPKRKPGRPRKHVIDT